MGVAILFLAETLMKFILLRHKCIHEVGVAIIAFATVYRAATFASQNDVKCCHHNFRGARDTEIHMKKFADICY